MQILVPRQASCEWERSGGVPDWAGETSSIDSKHTSRAGSTVRKAILTDIAVVSAYNGSNGPQHGTNHRIEELEAALQFVELVLFSGAVD